MKGGINRIFAAGLLLAFLAIDFGCSNNQCPELDELNVNDYFGFKSVITDYNLAYGIPPESLNDMRKFVERDAKELGYQEAMRKVLSCDEYIIKLTDEDLSLFYKDTLLIILEVTYGDVLYNEGKFNTDGSLKDKLKKIKKEVLVTIDEKRESYEIFYNNEALNKNEQQRVLLVNHRGSVGFVAEGNPEIEMLNPLIQVLNSSSEFSKIDSMSIVVYLPDTILNRPPSPSFYINNPSFQKSGAN